MNFLPGRVDLLNVKMRQNCSDIETIIDTGNLTAACKLRMPKTYKTSPQASFVGMVEQLGTEGWILALFPEDFCYPPSKIPLSGALNANLERNGRLFSVS